MAVLALAVSPAIAFGAAFTFTGTPATGSAGGSTSAMVVRYTADMETTDARLDLTVPAGFTPTLTPMNSAGCVYNMGMSLIRVTAPPTGSLQATADWCSITFAITGGTSNGSYDLNAASGSPICFNVGGGSSTACTGPTGTGAITVAAGGGNTPPTITYSPAQDSDGTSDPSAEVSFPAGAAGPASANITPSIVGGSGSGTGNAVLSGCTASSGFTITSGGSQTFPVAGVPANIVLGCTRGGSAQTGTLTCTETPSPSGSARTLLWDLSCPMASPGTAPTITYSPAQDTDGVSDGTQEISFPAGPAGAVIVSITPTITGGSGAGAVAVSCTTSSTFSTMGGSGMQTYTAGGAATDIVIGCTRGGTVQSGTLSCTETPSPAGAGRTLLWDLTCPSASGGGTMPPTVTYSPTIGTPVTMSGGTSGATSTGSVAVTINTDGSGTGASSTTTLNSCSVTGATGFTVTTTPGGGVSAVGNAGAAGSINVSCLIGVSAVIGGTLTCNEVFGLSTNTRSWPITCPAAAGGGLVATPVPALDTLGKTIMVLMILGLGLAVFLVSQRSA